MKKIISLLLVLMLVVSLGTAAFAADTLPTGDGSITVQGADMANKYTIYLMLDLSLNESNGAYTYTVNDKWADFFDADGFTGSGAYGNSKDYISINAAGAASWIGAESAARKEAFAKLAMEYVELKNGDTDTTNDIAAVRSSTVDGQYSFTNGNLVFDKLPLGYYLVDSTMGALCGLTTTNKHGSIQAKNGAPVILKKIFEEDTNQWVDSNTADVGEVVKFRVTIEVHAGAQNYVVHDKMDATLELDKTKFVLEHLVPGENPHTIASDLYTISYNTADGCTFEIAFTQAFCDLLTTNDSIVITYEAKLLPSATRWDNASSSGTNENTAWMTYGDIDEPHETEEEKTKTYTYLIDLIKTDAADTPLFGATFKIYNTSAIATGNEIAVVWDAAKHAYVRAADRATGDIIMVDEAHTDALRKLRIEGLDKGTYYLEEITAPEGYNKLTTRQAFTISTSNLEATYTQGVYTTGSGVQVINSTGTRLPETGGLGTLLFTILGGSTALGTGVVLVTKKRMSKIEDED